MKATGTISVEHNPGDPLSETDTDWAAVEALTDAQIREASLSDPDSVPVPVYNTLGLHRIVNTQKLRNKLGLTQEAFAARYRIPVGTLRDWEQNRKMPDAPARAYLLIIERNPGFVAELLGSAA